LHPHKKKIQKTPLIGHFQKKKKIKKFWFLNGLLRVFSREKNYENANQTENFIGAKTENDIYYRGEKHY